MSDRLQRSIALMDAKADVKMIKERTNECWYDTKILANAVYLILEELTATDTADTPHTELLVKTPRKSRESHEKNCETCRDKDAYDEWQGNCDECENGSMYTPQTEICDTCKYRSSNVFGNWCVGKDTCDRYEADTPQTDCGWR